MNTVLINNEISQFIEVVKNQFGHCEWNTFIGDSKHFKELKDRISKGRMITNKLSRELASLEVGKYEIKLLEYQFKEVQFRIIGKTKCGNVIDLGETHMKPRLEIIHSEYDLLKSMQIAMFHHIQMEQLNINEYYYEKIEKTS